MLCSGCSHLLRCAGKLHAGAEVYRGTVAGVAAEPPNRSLQERVLRNGATQTQVALSQEVCHQIRWPPLPLRPSGTPVARTRATRGCAAGNKQSIGGQQVYRGRPCKRQKRRARAGRGGYMEGAAERGREAPAGWAGAAGLGSEGAR